MPETLPSQTETRPPLPDFSNPPVIEVVYGIQFEPIGFRSPIIGLFWQSIRSDYPMFQEMPVLEPAIETFGLDTSNKQGEIQLLPGPPIPRLFFIDKTGHWVLQLQNDRLLHNWRKVDGEGIYPRFGEASKRFFDAWERLRLFCKKEQFSLPVMNQLELTYINHIPIAENVDPFKEANTVFPDMRWRENHSFLPAPETLVWKTSFVLPDRQGRLHVSLRHALRRKDNLPVLLFELTVRGMPHTESDVGVKQWFASAREWIVRGFADLTEESVQRERWGRNI